MEMDEEHPTWNRLESQIEYFSDESQRCQFLYKSIKGLEILAAATITAVGYFSLPSYIPAILGLTIMLCEAVLQLQQYHQNWIRFRSTAEILKAERHLYLASIGPYNQADDSISLLANRIEKIISYEVSEWAQLTDANNSILGRHLT